MSKSSLTAALIISLLTHSASSSPKKFVSEELVATHLQQLHLATSNNPSMSTTSTATTSMVPPPSNYQCPFTATPPLCPPSLLSVSQDLLSSPESSSLLASAAKSHPLSMKTVASCSTSLETGREGMLWENEVIGDTSNTDIASRVKPVRMPDMNYPSVVDVPSIRSQSPAFSNSLQSRTHLGRVELDYGDDNYLEKMRTSPKHKRPLDQEEVEEEGGKLGVTCERRDSWSLLLGPRTKRSKVDIK